MKQFLLITTACVALFTTPASAAEKVAEAGQWAIGKEEGAGAGACFASTEYQQSGMRFFIGQVRSPDNHNETAWLLTFRNNKWNLSFKETEASIEVYDANNKTRKKWSLTVTMENEGHGFYAFVKKEVIDSMSLDKKAGFKLIVNKHEIGRFSLDQSGAAIRAVRGCLALYTPPTKEATPDSKPTPKEKMWGFGTGFFVTYKHVMTNNHVVEQCVDKIQLLNQDMWGPGGAAGKVVAQDKVNDLALITSNVQSNRFAQLRIAPIPAVGEHVWVYGYPLQGILSEPNFTPGMVAATSGMNGKVSELQITAPVQSGNSGSPLLDKFGNVIGVVVSKLNAGRINEQYGDIPQNINFAVKASIAMAFMSTHGIEPTITAKTTPIDPTEIARTAGSFTINVRCEVKGES